MVNLAVEALAGNIQIPPGVLASVVYTAQMEHRSASDVLKDWQPDQNFPPDEPPDHPVDPNNPFL